MALQELPWRVRCCKLELTTSGHNSNLFLTSIFFFFCMVWPIKRTNIFPGSHEDGNLYLGIWDSGFGWVFVEKERNVFQLEISHCNQLRHSLLSKGAKIDGCGFYSFAAPPFMMTYIIYYYHSILLNLCLFLHRSGINCRVSCY